MLTDRTAITLPLLATPPVCRPRGEGRPLTNYMEPGAEIAEHAALSSALSPANGFAPVIALAPTNGLALAPASRSGRGMPDDRGGGNIRRNRRQGTSMALRGFDDADADA